MERFQGSDEAGAGKKLALQSPFGKTALLAVVAILLFLSAGELLLRTAALRTVLPSPSYGIGHQNIDYKFAHLSGLLGSDMAPSCFFVGSSVVDTDMNPERVAATLFDESGQELLCYNFGIGGLILPSIRKVVRVLRGMGADGVLVVGITPFDFEERNIRMPWQRSEEQINESDWINHRLGQKSLNGWIIDRSMVYRHFLRFRQWLESPDHSRKVSVKESSSRLGFSNFQDPGEFQHQEKKLANVRKKLKSFKTSPRRMQLIGQIAEEWGPERTIFAEIPLHPELHEVFPGGEEAYGAPLLQAAAALEQGAARYLGLGTEDFSSPGYWKDYFHLNHVGAVRYSDWLAGQLAVALAGESGTAP